MNKMLSHAMRTLALAAALAFAPLASAIYVFNTVDYPSAVFTDVRGINGTGRIVGYASLDGVTNFGFSYAGGVFSPLPAAPFGTVAHGINDAGVIVGSTGEAHPRGLIYDGTSYTFFARAGWDATEARAISNTGVVTGFSYNLGAGGEMTATAGFIYDPVSHIFTDISFPTSSLTIAQGVNVAGQVVGSAVLHPGGAQGFLREPAGSITFFTVGGFPTRARSLNDVGIMAGWVTDTALGRQRAFVADSGGYQLLDVPGAAQTIGEAINNAGQMSGLWTDAGDVTHGFIATPAAMPTGTTLGGAYTFSVVVVPNVPIFIDPPVATGYDYAIGKGDPRIATVQLPIGVGDSLYGLKVGGRKFVVAGGEWFDFRAHGFPDGVPDFRVGCIEASSALDPANPQAFPTGLTFVAAGHFTGTQKPRTRNAHAADGASCSLDD